MIWISPNLFNYQDIVLFTCMIYTKLKTIDIETKTFAWTKFLMDQINQWSKSLGGANIWGPKCPGAEMSRGRNV